MLCARELCLAPYAMRRGNLAVPALPACWAVQSAVDKHSSSQPAAVHDSCVTPLRNRLQEAAIPSIPVTSVAGAQADGYTLIDVRPPADFEAYHPPGAVSVPLFGPIKLDSPSKFLKQLLYSANGMQGTDENVNFVEQARRVAASVATICATISCSGCRSALCSAQCCVTAALSRPSVRAKRL